MSAILTAELAATCSALGFHQLETKKYYTDDQTLETVKDLIRYLRRDDENHDIRRQLGDTKVMQTDLLPMLKAYWEETDLFDVLLRLLVNLTTPALMLWNEEIPTEKLARNYYLQVVDHLKNYKEAFVDKDVWNVLGRRLSKILEIDYAERGDENSLIIERILILLRNILYVPIDPYLERPDDDASIHDQVLWSLQQSNMLDIILYMSSSPSEQAYYMHILEILCFMLREQKASELAKAAGQKSETEKQRDHDELAKMRQREAHEKQQKLKKYTGARHSRFCGTYVVKSMKSISDNELIYHKPLNKLDELNFDVDKKKPKTPKNRLPVSCNTFERRSAVSIRLLLKDFCVEFLNGSYNAFMNYIRNTLARGKAQDHDESYYFWAVRFFMEMNRCHKFDIKLVSETMAVQTFHYIQREMEKQFDMMQTEKKKAKITSRRLHLALLAYRELFLTLCAMDASPDGTVRDSSKVIKSNIFYVPEYRELILTLLITYDEIRSSDLYLKDLIETQHVFIKMLQKFCGKTGSVVVKDRSRKKKKKTKKVQQVKPLQNLELLWDEVAPQLSAILESGGDFTTDVAPFDATSDTPIDDQKVDAMKNIQSKLRNGEYESGIGLVRASREVWPTDDEFGNSNMSQEDEFTALKDIFFADINDEDHPQPVENQEDEDDDEEEDDYDEDPPEREFKLDDFVKRLAHPRIVRACGLALRTFKTNTANTNHCIVKLLHRIAFECKMYVMLFQLSIFRTFQQIFKLKELPEYGELVKFSTYIVRQFFKVAEKNKKIYMEVLFWKSSKNAYEIEEGYGCNQKNSSIKTWTEQDEDELRRLFMEHREKEIEDDVVDWICNNLIDNTRTRRSVLKKLKELMLIVGNKPKSSARAPRVWGEEEEEQLQELFAQFKDSSDPVGCIMERLTLRRPRNRIVEKLLVLGLIQDKNEVRKKRAKKSKQGETAEDDFDKSETSEGESDDSTGMPRLQRSQQGQPTQRKQQNNNKKSRKNKSTATRNTSKNGIIKLLLELESEQMSDALEWLKESFSDVVEDLADTEEVEMSIPLVPILDCAVDAVENVKFQNLLKAMSMTEPEIGQEIYWRIPESISASTLKELIDLLSKVIDRTLELPTEEAVATTSDSQGNIDKTVDAVFSKKNAKLSSMSNRNDNEEDTDSEDDQPRQQTQRQRKQQKENAKKKSAKRKPKSSKNTSNQAIIKLLLDVDSLFADALEWLKDSFSDVIEDNADTEEVEMSVVLVPISNCASEAIENTKFQDLLKAMGITKPDSQEMYWRIPESIPIATLKEYVALLSQTIDKTLEFPVEETDSSSRKVNRKKKTKKNNFTYNGNDEDSDQEENDNIEQETTNGEIKIASSDSILKNTVQEKKKHGRTRLIDSESEEDETNDFDGTLMQSTVKEKKKQGRTRLIDSESEEDETNNYDATLIRSSVNHVAQEEESQNVAGETAEESVSESKKRNRRLIDSDDSENESSVTKEENSSKKRTSDLQNSDSDGEVQHQKKARKRMKIIDSDEEI